MDKELVAYNKRRKELQEFQTEVSKKLAAARMELVKKGPDALGGVMALYGQVEELQIAIDKLATMIEIEERAVSIALNAKKH